MNVKQTRFENFSQVLGEFLVEGLNALRGDKAALVNAAHEAGTAEIRLVVKTSPVTIVAFLQPKDMTIPPVELWRVPDDGPQERDFN